jgi:GNAT superfamily N-acetyltransferase
VSAAPDDVLTRDAVGAIAGLCRSALGSDSPEPADLEQALFSTANPGDAPAIVRGDPDIGVVATVQRGGAGYIRLLAVHPALRRRGIGSALLAAAEADLDGCSHAQVGADAPDYLFPGVCTRMTEMLCLMEARRYRRGDVNLNMGVDLTNLDPDPGGASLATEADTDEVRAWTQQHWASWADEVMRALAKDRLLISRDAQGVAGFCAWDVNRGGWLGPIAVRPSELGGRIGVPLLMGALHRMRADGRRHAEISWISPIRFYVRNAGATISDAYIVHRRRIAPRPTETP